MRLRAIGHAVFLFVVARMIGWAWCRTMTHHTIFWCILAIVAFKTVFHFAFNIVAVEVFPVGNAGMAAITLEFFMFFVGKFKRLFETLPCPLSMPGLFEMTKATVSLFSRLKVTFETAFFTRTTKSIVYFKFLCSYTAGSRINNRDSAQRLPASRQTRHGCGVTGFTINMTGVTAYRVLVVCLM